MCAGLGSRVVEPNVHFGNQVWEQIIFHKKAFKWWKGGNISNVVTFLMFYLKSLAYTEQQNALEEYKHEVTVERSRTEDTLPVIVNMKYLVGHIQFKYRVTTLWLQSSGKAFNKI